MGLLGAVFFGGWIFPIKFVERFKDWAQFFYIAFIAAWIFLWYAILYAIDKTYLRGIYDKLKAKADESGKSRIEEYFSEHEMLACILFLCAVNILFWFIWKA